MTEEEKKYYSSEIRRACDFAYRKKISCDTWKNWRIYAGVAYNKNFLSEKQAKTVVACCVIRFTQRNENPSLLRTPITLEQVRKIKAEKGFDLFFERLLEQISAQAYTEDRVYGRDLPKILDISITTIRSRIKNFSLKTCYSLKVLRENHPDLFAAIDIKIS